MTTVSSPAPVGSGSAERPQVIMISHCTTMDNLSSEVLGFFCICRLSRLGQPFSAVWVTKLQSWVDAWDEADEHVVQSTGAHTARWFRLTLPGTRYGLTCVSRTLILRRSHTSRVRGMPMPVTGT